MSEQFPTYKCHKIVHALKIVMVERHEKGALITPAEEGHAPFEVTVGYVEKHDPQPGGYYVVYEDGYTSFSPAEAFEAGYTRFDAETSGVRTDFGWAVTQLYAGRRVTRRGWNGPEQYLELQVPDENSKMTLPYIYIRTVQGDLVPWLASQTDMLATDWEKVG